MSGCRVRDGSRGAAGMGTWHEWVHGSKALQARVAPERGARQVARPAHCSRGGRSKDLGFYSRAMGSHRDFYAWEQRPKFPFRGWSRLP